MEQTQAKSFGEQVKGEAQIANKPMDGDRLTSPIFIISAGSSHKRYAVHQDVLKQSTVLACMCKGDFKEAHQRQINLPDDDPIDIGILAEYLYMHNFWIDGDPQPGTSKQDSAIRLAQLYRLANKYDLENMKDIVIDKLPLYTNIWHPEQWLAVAEIIYAVIPNSDEKYPKILRSLITRYLEIKGAQGVNGLNGAMLDCIAKGGRLATDISRGSRKFWARRVREISMIGGGFRRGAPYPDMNLNDEESYDDDIISGKKF